jgi:hypothetical protein
MEHMIFFCFLGCILKMWKKAWRAKNDQVCKKHFSSFFKTSNPNRKGISLPLIFFDLNNEKKCFFYKSASKSENYVV